MERVEEEHALQAQCNTDALAYTSGQVGHLKAKK
jgi:hypothetical protein